MNRICTLIVALLASHLSAATFYIDFVSGSDTSTSTQAQSQTTPWKYLPGMSGVSGNAAAYSVQPGDVFVLKGGVTWTFASTSNDLLTVTASSITIRGGQQLGTPWGSGYPTIDGSGSTGTRAGISAISKTNCVVDGIRVANIVEPSDGSGYGIAVYYLANDWTVSNCNLDQCGVDGLVYSPLSGSNFTFCGNTVVNCGRVHIAVDSGVKFAHVNIYSNNMLGNASWPAHSYHGDGFMIGANCTNNPSTFTDINIHHNKFLGDWSTGATALIYLNNSDGPANSTRSGGYHCKIYDNQICIDSDGFISPALMFIACGWKDVQIYNNTFNAVTSTPNNIGAAISLAYLNSDADIVVKNNILSGCTHGILCQDLDSSSLSADYNLYQTIATNHFIWDKNNRWDTLAALRAAGYEAHGKVGDPLFASLPNGTAGSGNWTLQTNSPALLSGANLSSLFTTDLGGTNRPSTGPWDIGAYGFGSGSTNAPSTTNATIQYRLEGISGGGFSL